MCSTILNHFYVTADECDDVSFFFSQCLSPKLARYPAPLFFGMEKKLKYLKNFCGENSPEFSLIAQKILLFEGWFGDHTR